MSNSKQIVQSNDMVKKKKQPLEAAGPAMELQGQQANPASLQRAISKPGLASPEDILALQQTIGNRGTSRVLGKGTGAPVVQAKLTVGPVGDKYEQQADQAAKQVVNSGATSTATQRQEEGPQMKPLVGLISSLQRQVAQPEEDELGQGKREVQRAQEEDELAQGKRAADDGSFEAGSEVESQLRSQKGGGNPLPDNVRGEMEGAFGADFSGVRVHTGGEATQLNSNLQAQAFTHGNDIFFNSGKYNPSSSGGEELLAHELTHTIQQGASAQRKPKSGEKEA